MKFFLILLVLFQFGCAAQQTASQSTSKIEAQTETQKKRIITVYNSYELYSYVYIGDVTCDIAANDKSVQANVTACIAVLHEKARRLNGDAVHITKEEDCLKDKNIDCEKSSAVRMTAQAHRID